MNPLPQPPSDSLEPVCVTGLYMFSLGWLIYPVAIQAVQAWMFRPTEATLPHLQEKYSCHMYLQHIYLHWRVHHHVYLHWKDNRGQAQSLGHQLRTSQEKKVWGSRDRAEPQTCLPPVGLLHSLLVSMATMLRLYCHAKNMDNCC